MNISLSGKLYVHFVKSVFVSNKKIGIEFIIDTTKSEESLIDGLKRLRLLDRNKFFIENEYIKQSVRIYDKKYTCIINLLINDQNKIILEHITDINYDKINMIVDKKLFIPNYSISKNKTVLKIMDILNE